MARQEPYDIILKGKYAWNKWRKENPNMVTSLDDDFYRIDLSQADLSGIDLIGANLTRVNLHKANLQDADLHSANMSLTYLHEANLRGAKLWDTNLYLADLCGADLSGSILNGAIMEMARMNEIEFDGKQAIKTNLKKADLRGAHLRRAELIGADLRDGKLSNADLRGANLIGADLRGATLGGTNLSEANLSNANLQGATLTSCKVYAISAWGLKFDEKTIQKDLIVTPDSEPSVVVENLEMAQFVYLLLNNEKIRGVIDTIGRKAVLILGRFTPDRKMVLDALRSALNQRGYVPIIFNFNKPTTKDFTETIKILAGMSLFVIADITKPKSSPLELQATVPEYMIPFVPIIQEGEEPFSMLKDLSIKFDKWVLPTKYYNSSESLIRNLDEKIINPAIQLHNRLEQEKSRQPEVEHLR